MESAQTCAREKSLAIQKDLASLQFKYTELVNEHEILRMEIINKTEENNNLNKSLNSLSQDISKYQESIEKIEYALKEERNKSQNRYQSSSFLCF
jgi:predicted nuclease with TOPRIM domain